MKTGTFEVLVDGIKNDGRWLISSINPKYPGDNNSHGAFVDEPIIAEEKEIEFMLNKVFRNRQPVCLVLEESRVKRIYA